jgi:putative PIN family toxin of toxin-antitoxin system
MGATRIIIDTNVLISALGWPGKPRQILGSVLCGELELLISKKQWAEIKRVLNYPKLKFSEEQKQRFLDILANVAHIVETHNTVNIIKEDTSDNMFLEAALETNAEFIISGNLHLLKLKEFKGTLIITPAQFLEK